MFGIQDGMFGPLTIKLPHDNSIHATYLGRLVRHIAYILVPLLGVLIALATGVLANNHYSYGFPLAWKTLVATGNCSPIWQQIACYLKPATSYDWTYFALDAAFYTGIGYGLFPPSAKFWKFTWVEFEKSLAVLRRSLKGELLKWNELARPFRVISLMGIVGGLYAPLMSPWSVIVSSFFSGVQPSNSGPFNPVSVAALVVFIAVPGISIGGAVALVALPMHDDQRGILSLFVTVSSFFPTVYLGLQILAWILQEWQFAIIAIFWSALLFITARTLWHRAHSPS